MPGLLLPPPNAFPIKANCDFYGTTLAEKPSAAWTLQEDEKLRIPDDLGPFPHHPLTYSI